LEGVRVVELAGLGATPFAGMLLADMGADVILVERRARWDPRAGMAPRHVLTRSRRSIAVDLKHPDAVEAVLRLTENADILIEGYRPGVAERLGLGPEDCMGRNPALVYGRMTGWGQDGPLAHAAGHDIVYVALTGVLGQLGRPEEPPPPPLNAIGDFGGGAVFCAMGVLAALLEARASGQGQVVDAAMVDGAATFTTMLHEMAAQGQWSGVRGTDLINGGAHFYEVYETADGKHVAVGAIEPEFYVQLMETIGVEDQGMASRLDRSQWPAMKERMAAAFRTRTRAEWVDMLEGTDACFAPVLDLDEATRHRHNVARGTFTEVGGVTQAAPAPRFSRTPSGTPRPRPDQGEHTEELLSELGYSASEIQSLREMGAVGVAEQQ
jgi:alpha-methylacyl-CoA racemase